MPSVILPPRLAQLFVLSTAAASQIDLTGQGSAITMNGATLTVASTAGSVVTFITPTDIVTGKKVTAVFAGVSPTCAGAYPSMPCATGTGELHPKLFSCVWTCPDGKQPGKNITSGPFAASLWLRAASSTEPAASQTRLECTGPDDDELAALCEASSLDTTQSLRLTISHALAGPLPFAGLPDGDRISCKGILPPTAPPPTTPPPPSPPPAPTAPPPPAPPPPNQDCQGKSGDATFVVNGVAVKTFCDQGWLLIGKGGSGVVMSQRDDVGAYVMQSGSGYLAETTVRMLAAKSTQVKFLTGGSSWGSWTHGVVSAANSQAINALRNSQNWQDACGATAASCSWSAVSGLSTICFDMRCGSECNGKSFPCMFHSSCNGNCAHIGYLNKWSRTTNNMVTSMWINYRG
mgnify:CR=1 FL=1